MNSNSIQQLVSRVTTIMWSCFDVGNKKPTGMLFNQLSKEIPVKVPFLLRAGWWPTALDEISRDHRFLQIRIISYSRHFGRFATEFPYGLSSLTRLPPLYRSNLPNDSVANGYPLNSLWVHNISWYSLSLSFPLSCLFVCLFYSIVSKCLIFEFLKFDE